MPGRPGRPAPSAPAAGRKDAIPIGARQALSEALLLSCMGWAKLCPRPGIPILCYHRIAGDAALATVAPRSFRRQMTLLRDEGYRIASLEEVISALTSGDPLPRRWLALTFDDGYRSFLTEAAPVLSEFGFTASVFVPTDFAGRPAEWDADGVASGESVLTWDEMRELQSQGFRFYPHSASHRRLTRVPEEELTGELRRARETMETELGRAAPICCYPYGDHDARVREAAREAGYTAACGLRPEANRSPGDLWDLHRFLVLRATTERGYRARATGAFGRYATLRRRLRGGSSASDH